MRKIFNGHENEGGIYKITNVSNGKFYIGSAKNFLRRARGHEKCLRNNRHRNKHLQASWNKYGKDAFLFEVVEIVEGNKGERYKVEQKYLDRLIKENLWEKTFNIRKKTVENEPSCFSKNPEETRRKISEAAKKRLSDPVNRAKHKAAVEKLAKTYEFISPEGELVKITNLKEFCRKHPDLLYNGMHDVWTEKIRSYKGWFKHNPKTDFEERKKKGYEKISKKLAKSYQFVSPEGEVTTIRNLKEFCRDNQLIHASMHGVWTEKRQSHKGWRKYNGTVDWDERKRRACEKQQKPVYQFSEDGIFIQKFNSISDAASSLGCSKSAIQFAASGKNKTAKGFLWSYNDSLDLETMKKKDPRKKVYQFDLQNNFIKEWSSAKDAASAMGCSRSTIRIAASGKNKTAKGFLWSYNDSIDFDKIKRSYKGYHKPVYQYSLDGSFIKKWNSIAEATSAVGLKSYTNISACARGRKRTAKGFVWKFDNKPIDQEKLKIKKRGGTPKKVYQFDLQNNLLREWNSISEAARELGCDISSISACARGKQKTAYNFVWRYDPPKSK